MSDDRTKAPWDVRLTGRWAREAREAANAPTRYERTDPLRERMKTFSFWVGLVAYAAAWFALWANSAAEWARILAAAVALVLVAAGRLQNRRGAAGD
jgi:hypothetical protein